MRVTKRSLTVLLLTLVLTFGLPAVETLDKNETYTNNSNTTKFILDRDEMENAVSDSQLLNYYKDEYVPELENEIDNCKTAAEVIRADNNRLIRDNNGLRVKLTNRQRLLLLSGLLIIGTTVGGIYLW